MRGAPRPSSRVCAGEQDAVHARATRSRIPPTYVTRATCVSRKHVTLCKSASTSASNPPWVPHEADGPRGEAWVGLREEQQRAAPWRRPWEGAPTAPRQSSWIWRFLLSETKAPADPARRKGEEGRAGSAFWKLLRKGEPMSCVLSLGGVAWRGVFTAGHLGPWRGISPVTLPTARMRPDTSPGGEVLKRFRWTLCHEPSTVLSVALSPELSQTLFPEQELFLSAHPSSQ